MNTYLSPSGYQTSRQMYKKMKNPTVRITTHGTIVTIVKNMDMFLRIELEIFLEEITIDGWVRLHALVVSRLVMLVEIIQLGH